MPETACQIDQVPGMTGRTIRDIVTDAGSEHMTTILTLDDIVTEMNTATFDGKHFTLN